MAKKNPQDSENQTDSGEQTPLFEDQTKDIDTAQEASSPPPEPAKPDKKPGKKRGGKKSGVKVIKKIVEKIVYVEAKPPKAVGTVKRLAALEEAERRANDTSKTVTIRIPADVYSEMQEEGIDNFNRFFVNLAKLWVEDVKAMREKK